MPPAQGPPNLSPGQVVFVLYLIAVLAAAIMAWIWAIYRLAVGRALLEPAPVGPRAVPWGAFSVGATILLYVLLQTIAAGFVAIVDRVGLMPARAAGEVPSGVLLTILTLTNLAIVGAVPALLWFTSGATREDFLAGGLADWGRDLRRGAVAFLLLGPIVYLILFIATVYLHASEDHTVEKFLKAEKTPAAAALVLVSAVIAAPVAEELLFRGVLLGWLTTASLNLSRRRERRDEENSAWFRSETLNMDPIADPFETDGPPIRFRKLPLEAWLANAVVSLFFAAIHYEQWPAPIPLFLLSMGLGWLAQRTGGLAAPVGLHMAFNAYAMISMLLIVFGGVPTEVPPAPDPAVVAISALIESESDSEAVVEADPTELTERGRNLSSHEGSSPTSPPGAASRRDSRASRAVDPPRARELSARQDLGRLWTITGSRSSAT